MENTPKITNVQAKLIVGISFAIRCILPLSIHYSDTNNNFINKKEAVTNVHKPKDINSLKKADLHLIYEELFTFMLKVSYLKEKNASDGKFNIKSFDEDKVNNFINSLPFSLTDGQMQAVSDIKGDFLS